MNQRRLYSTLGIPVDADEISIRRASKKLTALYVSGEERENPRAAEIVQEIRAAMKVLSDPERRAIYDEFGDASLKKGFSPTAARAAIEKERLEAARRVRAAMLAPTAVARREAAPEQSAAGGATRRDWDIHVAIGPRLARSGGAFRLPVTRPVMCPRCEGSGRRDAVCPSCKGERKVVAQRIESCVPCHGVGLTGEQVRCKGCKGTGRRKRSKCRRCDAAGVMVQRYECGACGGRGLKLTRFEQACANCRSTGLASCKRCDGATTIEKTALFRLMVPSRTEQEQVYRYAGAGFSNYEGAPTDLYVRFTILAKAPRR